MDRIGAILKIKQNEVDSIEKEIAKVDDTNNSSAVIFYQ
jgi:hypothetical protein